MMAAPLLQHIPVVMYMKIVKLAKAQVQKEIDATIDCGCSVVDNYYGTINEGNYKEYMIDHKHYNDKGREILADRIAYIINNKLSTVQSPSE